MSKRDTLSKMTINDMVKSIEESKIESADTVWAQFQRQEREVESV